MNVNNGLPEGFYPNLVKQKFPADKPIFWGPNQSTTYPNEYNEPSGWINFDLMKIPIVVRFIRGGTVSPEPIMRAIYLGLTKTHNVGVFAMSDDAVNTSYFPLLDYEIPTPPPGTDIQVHSYRPQGFIEWEAFELVTEISSAYDANRSTSAVIGEFTDLVPVLKDYTDYFSKDWYGSKHGMHQWLIGADATGTQWKKNEGGKAGATVFSSGGLDWDEFGSKDTNERHYNQVDPVRPWLGNVPGYRGSNHGKITREDPQPFRVYPYIYWFLVNTIAGALENQTNRLVVCGGDILDPMNDLTPEEIEDLKAQAIGRAFSTTYSRTVEGLILQP